MGRESRTYDLRTWLGEGGRSSVDIKLLCAEEKSLLMSVLLLKGKGSCRSLLCIGRLGCFLRPLHQTHHFSLGAGVECHCKESAV